MHKTSLLYLIVYLLFYNGLICQNLKLNIEGASNSESQIIDSLYFNKTHPNYTSIESEVDNVQNTLFKIGFIENELKYINRVNDSVFSAKIQLHKRYRTISIYYDKAIIDFTVLKMISTEIQDDHFKLDINNIDYALNYINSKISEKGFPFSKLHLSNIILKDDDNLTAKLILESSGQKRTIDNIIIKGYDKFPRSYLKYYLKIKPEQTFNLENIKKKSQKLNNLRFSNESKSPEVLFSKDSTTLYLYLQKAKSNSFDGFLGFGTNEKTSKLEFNGYLDLNLTNNLNYGESFKLLYKGEQNDQKLFETNLTLPYLFKSPIGMDLMLRIFKRDSSFTTVNQIVKLHYQINSKHKISAGVSNSQSNKLLQQNSSLPIFDYKTKYYSFSYQFLNRNNSNLLFPINSLVSLESNFGKRTETNSEEKQYLLNIDAFKILSLDPKNSLYFRANGSILNSKTYFENELLRFGGINSIRGFEENSIYATFFGIINSEYRYQINNSIYIFSITDAGYFENKISNSKEKLLGFGFGFGILTKAGLLRFNYANGKIENTPFKLSNSKIHLSLTANF